jgi:ABC-type lipoprotein export system ATPase subunit
VSRPLLSLESVSKTYWRGPHELHVLRDVSLDLHLGDFVAVYGQQSSGKTTLLKVAAGVEPPDEGCVRFDGQDLATLRRGRLSELRRDEIGWVRRTGPQSADLRMIDYVALPVLNRYGEREAQRCAKRALAIVGAEPCAFDQWATLSDGERMSVVIAHGLVREPRLLLVDDPTAGLDPIERERIVGLLRSFADEGTLGVLMTVPDLPATLRARDVRSLSGGTLLAPEAPPGGRGVVIDFPGSERSA